MKAIAAMLLLPCLAFGAAKSSKASKADSSAAEAACGPRRMKFEVITDKSQHPTPAPENGKAMVYVVQEDAGFFTSLIGVDGKWMGANRGRTYFFFPVAPGEHHLCAMATALGHRVSLHKLKAEAGQTYYFVPHNEATSARFVLAQADPDEGKDLVAKAKFATSHPKE